MSEDNFGKKLRDKLEDQAWPMPEAAWEGAQALMNGDRRRKRAGIIFFTTGLILLMIGLVPFILKTPESVLVEKASGDNNETKSMVSEGVSAAGLSDTPGVKAPEIKSPTLESLAIQAPQIEKQAPIVNPKKVILEKPIEVQTPKRKSIPMIKPVVKEAQVVKPRVVNVERPSPDNALGLERNELPSWAKAKGGQQPKNEEGLATDIPHEKDRVASEPMPLLGVDSSMVQPKAAAEVVAAASSIESAMTLTPAEVSHTVVTEEVSVTKPVDSIVAPPSVASPTIPQTPAQQPVPLFSIEGGVTVSSGWKAGSREGAGLTPDFGISWYVRNDHRSYFGVGVHYSSISGIKTFTHTSFTTVYGLGEQSNVKRISPYQLHYVMLPLRYYNYLGDKLVWGLGLNALYLLTTSSYVEEYSTVNGKSGEVKQYKESGYTQGFSWFDLQAAADMRYNVMNRWWVGGSLYYGFADIKNAFLTNNNKKENAMGIRLNLIYMIPRQ